MGQIGVGLAFQGIISQMKPQKSYIYIVKSLYVRIREMMIREMVRGRQYLEMMEEEQYGREARFIN